MSSRDFVYSKGRKDKNLTYNKNQILDINTECNKISQRSKRLTWIFTDLSKHPLRPVRDQSIEDIPSLR